MNRVRLTLLASLGGSLLVVAACSSHDDALVPIGSSSGAPSSSGGPLPTGDGGAGSSSGDAGLAPLNPAITAACTDLFDALVANVARCAEVDSPYVEANRASYLAVCTTQLRLPGTTPDLPSAAGACAIALGTSPCDQPDDVTCAGYYDHAGTLAAAATCESGSQCLSGSCITSVTFDDKQCGTCDAVANVGETCGSGIGCVNGTRCLYAATGTGTGTCMAPLPAAAACDSGDQCDVGLDCVQGACTSIPGVGQPCNEACMPAGVACIGGVCTALPATEGAACVSDQCAAPLLCSTAAGQCKAVSFTSDVGASCADPFTQCKPGLYCAGEVPVCAAYGALGAPCGQNDHDSRCVGFATCVAGTCQDYAPQCSY